MIVEERQASTEGIMQNATSVFQKIKSKLAAQVKDKGKVSVPKLDEFQSLSYDIAWAEAELFVSQEMAGYAETKGKSPDSLEKKLSLFFIAEALIDIYNRFLKYIANFGISSDEYNKETSFHESLLPFVQSHTSDQYATEITDQIINENHFGEYGLNEEQEMMRESFRSFAEDHVAPIAESVHRKDLSIPEEIIKSLSEMGCFGLSIPDTYGGFQSEESPDHVAIAAITEELSRVSLGVAGSLITRPEIVSKAILKGGTPKQKDKWLTSFASGEKLCAVAVTEPDHGSDVANLKTSAKKTKGGWLLNGVKTWCTFAGRAEVLLVLARTDFDIEPKHKGLSILLAEKPPTDKHDFEFTQESGGKISGRTISTLGYRGMHSYEVVFEDYFVPEENLIGEEQGLGKGFYLQMAGFAGGRFQTAARAAGLMQAALEKTISYAQERKVFSKPIIEYGLTKFKIAKIASITQAVRQATYRSARLLDNDQGQMEASLIKFYSSKISEWVTREAMQIHGGMGYAEEYAVSRYFVDARVFSIFEGAEDVLALRVIARSLLDDA